MKTRNPSKRIPLILLAMGLILGGGAGRRAGAFPAGGPGGAHETMSQIDDPAPMAGGVGHPVVYEPGSSNPVSLASHLWSDGANLGIGTTAPQYPLDVTGDVRGSGRVAFGNDAIIGSDGASERIFDFSHTITDFSTSNIWHGVNSAMTLDPGVDLVGPNATWIYGTSMISQVPPQNDKDFEFILGQYLGTWHQGTGIVDKLQGPTLITESWGDVASYQAGTFVVSDAYGPGSIATNWGLSIRTGHRGSAGSIANDYSAYIYSPENTRPLTNHYGIYLEDQDFGTNDSYAIYSAGGMNYLAGNLGIGTTQPQSALHVNGAIQLEEITEPATPATGFVLYVDQADGGLKAKSSGGTVTALAAY